jgi:erythrocyte band 7 integral membrane protein
MAKTGQSKVIFVPMQLQSDVVGQMAAQQSGSGGQAAIAEGSDAGGLGSIGNAAMMNSMSNI